MIKFIIRIVRDASKCVISGVKKCVLMNCGDSSK